MPYVPLDFSPVSAGLVQIQHPVRGATWRTYAEALQWLQAHGQTIIPATRWDAKAFAAGTSKTLRCVLYSRVQAKTRTWRISLSVAAGSASTVTFTDPSGGTSTSPGLRDLATIVHVETITSRANGPVQRNFTIACAAGGGALIVHAVSCVEDQRVTLELDATDLGVNPDSIVVGSGASPQPIYDAGAYVSLGGVARALTTLRQRDARTLFDWFAPQGDGIATSSGTFVDLFEQGPPLLASKLFRGSTTGTAEAWVYYRTAAATAGEIRFTMTSGATTTLALPAATGGAWLSTSFAVDCEDLTAVDGRRSARFDVCTIGTRRVSGAGSVSIETISIGEVRT